MASTLALACCLALMSERVLAGEEGKLTPEVLPLVDENTPESVVMEESATAKAATSSKGPAVWNPGGSQWKRNENQALTCLNTELPADIGYTANEGECEKKGRLLSGVNFISFRGDTNRHCWVCQLTASDKRPLFIQGGTVSFMWDGPRPVGGTLGSEASDLAGENTAYLRGYSAGMHGGDGAYAEGYAAGEHTEDGGAYIRGYDHGFHHGLAVRPKIPCPLAVVPPVVPPVVVESVQSTEQVPVSLNGGQPTDVSMPVQQTESVPVAPAVAPMATPWPASAAPW